MTAIKRGRGGIQWSDAGPCLKHCHGDPDHPFAIPFLPTVRDGDPAVVRVKSNSHQFGVLNFTCIEWIGPEVGPVVRVLDVQLNQAIVDSHDRHDEAANAN